MKRNSQKVAADLINSAVKVIAKYGFGKASTRNIANECGLADAYIYHHFDDKEDLFYRAYQMLDASLAEEIKSLLPIIRKSNMKRDDLWFSLFSCLWKKMTESTDNCKFCVQYYFSPYYIKYSRQEHARLWMPIVNALSSEFVSEDEAESVLKLAFNMMMGLAINALNDGSIKSNEIAIANFDMVYSIIKPKLKSEADERVNCTINFKLAGVMS